MDYILILAGLVGLFIGGEALVRGSVSIAHRLAISPFVIGLTVVGFGTSTPELLVSIQAALGGVPDIAVGNVVGSNIANILLIIGLTALVWPIRINAKGLGRDVVVMCGAALLLLPLFAMGIIPVWGGAVLVAALAGYLTWTFLATRGQDVDETDLPAVQSNILISVVWVAFGLAALLFGARFLIDGSVAVARDFGVSEAFIGLTIVAIGTSLPELATSLIAALRRQSDMALGNVIGSNIFNVLGILGVTALVSPIPVAPRFLTFDLPIMIAVTLGFAALLLLRPVIGRSVGLVMLVGYVAYIIAAQ